MTYTEAVSVLRRVRCGYPVELADYLAALYLCANDGWCSISSFLAFAGGI